MDFTAMTTTTYLDENGEPIPQDRVYLDDNGNVIKGPSSGLSKLPGDRFADTVPGYIAGKVSDLVTEGGPAALGTIGGGMVGGPAGAVLGGMTGQALKHTIDYFTGSDRAPQSPGEAIGPVVMAGAAGALGPESAAARYPLASRPTMGGVVPKGIGYKEAKDIAANERLGNIRISQEAQQMRYQNSAALRAEKEQAQKYFDEEVARRVSPLREQKTEIKNYRTQKSAELAEQRTSTRENLMDDLSQLNKLKKEGESAISLQARQNAEAFSREVGREMTRREVAEGSLQSMKMGAQSFTNRVTKIYDKIRDDIFTDNIVKAQTGKRLADGTMETKDVIGGINRKEMQDSLREFADSNREALTIAQQNGSQGAKAIMDIVDGPVVVAGRTAIDDLAALNKAGYGKADAVIRERGEGVVLKTAAKYRETLRSQVAKMKGGKEATDLLDEAAALLSQRNELYQTGVGVQGRMPIARNVGRRIQATGNAFQYVDDPIAMKALYAEVGVEAREGMKQQIAKRTIGKSHKDFAINWSKMDPEVKSLNFTPEQIAQGNYLATHTKESLTQLANDTIKKNADMISDAAARLNKIGEERKLLGGETVKLRGLQDKITTELTDIKADSKGVASNLRVKLADAQQIEREQTAIMRQNYAIRVREARNKIQEIQDLKKKVLWGAGAAGLGIAGWNTTNVTRLLGW